MTYVVSDLHGQYTLYKCLIKRLSLSKDDRLIILGDVIDRGKDGIKILQDIIKRENVTLVLGNHEDILLKVYKAVMKNAARRAEYCAAWFKNGGEYTAREFFALPSKTQKSIIQYLEKCPLKLEVKTETRKFLLAHAFPLTMTETQYNKLCIKEKRYTMHDTTYFSYRQMLLWQRVEIDDEFDQDYTVVFGHTITAYYQEDDPYVIWKNQNKICIDCGLASYNNVPQSCQLACLCLDDLQVFYLNKENTKTKLLNL